MKLHPVTCRVYNTLYTDKYLPASTAWHKVAGIHRNSLEIAETVLQQLRELSDTPWLNRIKLDQGDGYFLWGYQRVLQGTRTARLLQLLLDGWQPQGSVTKAVADEYHQRLEQDRSRAFWQGAVDSLGRPVVGQGRWVCVGNAGRAAA